MDTAPLCSLDAGPVAANIVDVQTDAACPLGDAGTLREREGGNMGTSGAQNHFPEFGEACDKEIS